MSDVRHPAHWTNQKLKYVASLRSGEGITSDDISDVGEYPVYGGNGVRGYTSSYTHDGTYPLIGRQGALCGNINYASGKFWASEHAVVASVRGDHTIRWLGEVLRSMNLNQYSQSAAQPGISVEVIENLQIPVPPKSEQEAIANYLDRETARIDGLIAEKERMLALLEEKRAALISRVVTRGLDPNAPLKPSGQEWLGEIPAHWEMSRLKYLGETVLGLTFSPDDLVNDGEGVLVLRASNVKNRKIVLDDNIFVQTDIPHNLRTKPLDILICSRSGSRALIGKNALITDETSDLTFGAFMTVFRSDLNRFLFWVFNSPLFDFQAGAFGTSTINQLTTETLANMEVPVPPLEERDAIAEFLHQSSSHFDNAISAVSQSINLARERRAALITAVVTGQIALKELSL